MKAGEKAEGWRENGIGQERRKAGIPEAGRAHTAAGAAHPLLQEGHHTDDPGAAEWVALAGRSGDRRERSETQTQS